VVTKPPAFFPRSKGWWTLGASKGSREVWQVISCYCLVYCHTDLKTLKPCIIKWLAQHFCLLEKTFRVSSSNNNEYWLCHVCILRLMMANFSASAMQPMWASPKVKSHRLLYCTSTTSPAHVRLAACVVLRPFLVQPQCQLRLMLAVNKLVSKLFALSHKIQTLP
jgi:hypothetical protein